MIVTMLAYNGRFHLTLGEPLKACLGKPFVALPTIIRLKCPSVINLKLIIVAMCWRINLLLHPSHLFYK